MFKKASNKAYFHQAEKAERKGSNVVDVNIIAVDFSFLSKEINMRIGDRVVCGYCNASLSHLNKIENNKWKCHFCGHENESNLLPGEIPIDADLDYVIEPPTLSKGIQRNVILVCDTSGSMSLNIGKPRGDQYKTRLQCIKNALAGTIQYLFQNNPNTAVGIVCFGDKLDILGDCTSNNHLIKGKILADWDSIKDIAQQAPVLKPISKTKKNILKAIGSVEEQGCTSLGPALLYAVFAAGKIRGSQVILCTDGMANNGLGDLDTGGLEGREFYTKISNLAKDLGVTLILKH